jgi:hypothetical protein
MLGKSLVHLWLKRAVKVIRQSILKIITKHYVSLSRPSLLSISLSSPERQRT